MQAFTSFFGGKIFHNPVPTEVMKPGSILKLLKAYFNKPKDQQPLKPLAPFKTDLHKLHELKSDGLFITWIGHSTVIIEIDGKRILTDPVWYQRASPFKNLGPKRFFDPPLPLEALPPIDLILLSHDHYDHLDKNTILSLTSKKIPVVTLLKVGRRLIKWGVDRNLITELDWWQSMELKDGYTITALPSRHFSGRWLNDRFTTLWGSFAIKGPIHNVYFGADSGYYPGFKMIGEKLGPFDLTLLDTGAYHELWETIHMGPENAVQAHLDLKGKLLMPIHWGSFPLSTHSWTEPVERIIKTAYEKGVQLFLPAPGETCTAEKSYVSYWWR